MERIIIEDRPGGPIFRVSRQGFPATSENPDHFLLREDTPTLRPYLTGSVTLGIGGASASIAINLGHAPFVLLAASDGVLPTRYTFYARLSSNYAQMTIHNEVAARTISYYVFQNPLGGAQ